MKNEAPGAFAHPVLEAVWGLVEPALRAEPSTGDLFNPYRDSNPEHDRADAPAIRLENLRRYLAAYREPPELFLLAEAPGPHGCRFSGIPVTSEAQLVDDRFPLSGRPSGSSRDPHPEVSARIFWRALGAAFPRFFVWNSVPLHPHAPGRPLSIRTPRAAELRRFEPLVAGLLEILRPRRAVAIGRKAQSVLSRIGMEGSYVRHPSQGGAALFAEGIRRVLADLEAGRDR